MIELKGSFAGAELDKPTAQSARKIAEHYGLPVPKPGKPLHFRLNPKLTKIDIFGQKRTPASINIPAKIKDAYSVATNDSIEIELKSGIVRNNRIRITGEALTVNHNEVERAVWYMLAPQCKQSPFRDPNKPWQYTIYDPTVQAKGNLDLEKQKFAVQNDILNMLSWEVIEIRAKGLNVRGRSVDPELRDGPDATRLGLIRLLNEFPEDFLKAWVSDKTTLKGKLKHALDKSWIVYESKNQTGYFRWNGCYANQKIVTVRNSEDSFGQLFSAIQASEDHEYNLTKKLNDEVKELAESATTEAEVRTAAARAISVAPTVSEVAQAFSTDPDVVGQEMAKEESIEAAKQQRIDEAYGFITKAADLYDLISFDDDLLTVFNLNNDKEIGSELCKVRQDVIVANDGNWKLAAAKTIVEMKNSKNILHSLRMRVINKEKK